MTFPRDFAASGWGSRAMGHEAKRPTRALRIDGVRRMTTTPA